MIRGRVCAGPSLVGADASVPVFVSLGFVLVSLDRVEAVLWRGELTRVKADVYTSIVIM